MFCTVYEKLRIVIGEYLATIPAKAAARGRSIYRAPDLRFAGCGRTGAARGPHRLAGPPRWEPAALVDGAAWQAARPRTRRR